MDNRFIRVSLVAAFLCCAAEMREVANTLRSAGIEPLMTSATVARQDWRAALASAGAEVPSSAEALLDTLSSVPRLTRD